MIISISRNKFVNFLDISKDDNIRIINCQKPIELFDILDDLLAIDWLSISANAIQNINKSIDISKVTKDKFQTWLCSNHYYYKDSINNDTFHMLQYYLKDSPQKIWNRMYNSLLILNRSDFFIGHTQKELQIQFGKLFPKKYYFSPYTAENDSLTAVMKHTFSSTLEMLIYDVIKDIYYFPDNEKYIKKFNEMARHPLAFSPNANECGEKFAYLHCDKVLNEFLYQKEYCNYIGDTYSFERFFKDLFIAPWFKTSISQSTMDHIHILYSLLNSQDFFSILASEYNNTKSNKSSYGQDKLSINDFLIGDLNNRFACMRYVFECYEKYEMSEIDLYNVVAEESILLLAMYAKTNGKIAFAKCDVCGHYFIRNHKNKKEKWCRRCSIVKNTLEPMKSIKTEEESIQNNSQTTKGKMNREDTAKRAKIYKLFADGKKNLYDDLINLFRKKLQEVIEVLTKKHISLDYDKLYRMGIDNIVDQIEEEYILLSFDAEITRNPVEDFCGFYNEFLLPSIFFQCFGYTPPKNSRRLFSNEDIATNYKENSREVLHDLFNRMLFLFSNYCDDIDDIIELKNKMINIHNDIHDKYNNSTNHRQA